MKTIGNSSKDFLWKEVIDFSLKKKMYEKKNKNNPKEFEGHPREEDRRNSTKRKFNG